MTRREERKLYERIEDLYAEVHENNMMLRQIIKVINTYISRHHQENEEDFNRNVLANMISSGLGLNEVIGRGQKRWR